MCSVDASNTCRWPIERAHLTNARQEDSFTSGLYRLVPTADHSEMLFALEIIFSYGSFRLFFDGKNSNHVAGTNSEQLVGDCWLEDTAAIKDTNYGKSNFC